MAIFNVDGIVYTDKLPHSRIEYLQYAILKKEEGGGGSTLVVDDPSDVGDGLYVASNTININVTNTMDDSRTPITSGAVYNQLEAALQLMEGI